MTADPYAIYDSYDVSMSRYDWLQVTCDLDGAGMLSVTERRPVVGAGAGAGCADATLGRGRLPTSFTCAYAKQFFRSTFLPPKELNNTGMHTVKLPLTLDDGFFALLI